MNSTRTRITDTSVRLDAINEALKLAQPALSRVDFIPALCNFKVTPEDITAFNGSMGISIKQGVCDPCLIDGLLSVGMLGSLPNKRAVLKLEKGSLRVQAGKSHLDIPTIDVDEFLFDAPDKEGLGRIKVSPLMLEAISNSLCAAGRDATFPELLGVTLSEENASVTIFASDNYLLSRARTDVSVPPEFKMPIIMPTEFCIAMLEIINAYDAGCVDTSIYADSNTVMCSIADKALIFSQTPCTDTLPNFEEAASELAPEGGVYSTIPSEMISIIERSKLLVDKNSTPIVKIDSDGVSLTVTTRTQRGNAEESVPLSCDVGEFSAHADPTLLAKVITASSSISFHENAIIVQPTENHVYIVSLVDTE